MDISIMIEGQDGLTWARWQRLAAAVEQLGFAGLFRSDHFTNSEPPNKDSLEMVVSLAYLANSTQRIHFGPCVAPVSFRDPIMFARQALALDIPLQAQEEVVVGSLPRRSLDAGMEFVGQMMRKYVLKK